jgi:ankyrin repeat protein
VVAVRPLRIEELADVLAVDFDTGKTPMLNPGWRWSDHQEAVLSACSSLVTIVKDSDSKIVRFSHFSVKEFLMSDRLAESSRDVSQYHIQLEPAHTILAQACLGVLLRLDDSIDRNSIESSPLARYSAEHWVKHAQFGKVSSRIEEGMDCLFDVDKPHFATWLWIYNEDRPYESLSSMRPTQPDAVPLYHAVRRGFRDLAKRLLDKHVEHINSEDAFNATPLHASVSGGHIDVFSLLIEYFPNVDIRDTFGQTPLHLAAWRGHIEIGQQLLSRGADVNGRTVDGRTPLYVAAVWGQVNFARMLLGRGATVHVSDRDGRTPLHAAVSEGEVEAVRLLMEHDADPNARDRLERTPYTIASSREELEIVQLLSEYGAEFECIELGHFLDLMTHDEDTS